MSSLEPRPPVLRDMAPPLVVAPVVAAAIFGLATQSWPAAQLAAIAAVVVMLLVGWPALFWMIDNGRYGRVARTLAGVICGAAPFAAALASGVIGLYARSSDMSYVRWVLSYGASVPYFGVVTWPRFGVLLVLALAAGVATMWASKIFQSSPRLPRSENL